MNINTCVLSSGDFIWGIHNPEYQVFNLCETSCLLYLGSDIEGNEVANQQNFPQTNINVANKGQIIEVLNPFPFFGATYIIKYQADKFSLPKLAPHKPEHSEISDTDKELLTLILNGSLSLDNKSFTLKSLGRRLLMALAQITDNPEILIEILKLSCDMTFDKNNMPTGMVYKKNQYNVLKPVIHDHELFEIATNNPHLPYEYKLNAVLKPGVQGDNPVVGEYLKGNTHIWEYLRANSYIPWGHYASNMAHDSVRYSAEDLSLEDMIGLRHLYYQRIYINMAIETGISLPEKPKFNEYSPELEDIRLLVIKKIQKGVVLNYNGTIWGWNYGFDYSASGFRLNASHQQIHQQYALVKKTISSNQREQLKTFVIGDFLSDFIKQFKDRHNISFFDAYLAAIKNNKRFDNRDDLPASLIIHEDAHIILFAPKAQRCHGELQIMTKKPMGNILFCDTETRKSIDRAIYLGIKALCLIGTKMVTSYEISSRFDDYESDQRLIYCMLPRHPQSPGAFSEKMERWVTGHYPEDFAHYLREKIKDISLS